MKSVLKYTDEEDKRYGVAGMAISIVALDAESLLQSISMQSSPGEAITFAPEFYFSGHPRYSASLAWKEILQHFQLTMSLVLGNVMCRNYVLHRKPLEQQLRSQLMQLIGEEARESCSLDADEVRSMFDSSFNYLNRLFSHSGVQQVAREFAQVLSDHPTLSRSEVIAYLRPLTML